MGRHSAGILALVIFIVTLTALHSTPVSATPISPKVGVPAYFYPDVWNTPNDWYRMCDGFQSAGQVSTAVMNPGSGPGASSNSDYVTAVTRCHTDGQKVVGYVYTDYGARSIATVEAEIDAYASWYGTDGVFIDEMSNNASDSAYYATVYTYVHTNYPTMVVIGNPGSSASTDWQLSTPVADQLNIFEGPLSTYVTWTPPAWVSGYPSNKFWNVVYDAGGVSNMGAARAHQYDVNSDYLYVTNGTLPNPYGSLPSDPYWTQELSNNNVTVGAIVEPSLTFTVAGHNAGNCNGVALTATNSTNMAIPLGHPTPITNVVGAEDLSVATNAASGYSIFVRSPASMSDGRGHNVASVSGTNGNPDVFPAPGTAAVGYTTDHALTASGAGATRFQSDKWAALTNSNAEVAYSASTASSDTTCVGVQVGIAPGTPAGAYSMTLIYTAVAIY